MAMTPNDRLRAASRGSADQAVAYLRAHGARRADEAEACVRETYRLCALVGLDAAIAVARMGDETGARDGPGIFVSDIWATRLLSGGQGVTDGGDLGFSFSNGIESARGFVVHLARYAITEGDSAWDVLRPFVPLDPRFDAVPAPWRGTAVTLQDLQGRWFTHPQGAVNSAARGNAIFPGIPDQRPDQGGGGTPPMGKPKIVIDAGHRSTDRSGNPAEMALTGFMAAAYVDELRRRGYEAFWYQRDLDRDSDPDETIGNLTTVARGIGEWLASQPGALLFISCHYNGAHSPLHTIVPDAAGLVTAIPNGSPQDDIPANNPLDVRLATAIMRRFFEAGLGTLFHGKLGIPGLMSETETGVGLGQPGPNGFPPSRLAVFAATAASRARAVRLVIEHGGTSDPPALRDDFTERCAATAADAIDEVYAGSPPRRRFARRIEIPGELRDHRFDGRLYLVAARKRATLVADATPRQKADPAAEPVGADLKKGKTVTLEYVTVGADGKLWRASRRGTHLPADAFVDV